MRSSGASSKISSASTSSAALVIVISRSSSAPIISTASFVSVCVMPTSSPRPIMIFWIWAVEMPSAAARSLTVTPERTVAGPVGRRNLFAALGAVLAAAAASALARVALRARGRGVDHDATTAAELGSALRARATREPPGGLAPAPLAPAGGRPPPAAGRWPGRARGTARGGRRGGAGLRRAARAGALRRALQARLRRGARGAVGTAATEGARCGGLVDGVSLQAHAGLGEAAGHLSGIEPALAGDIGYTLSRHTASVWKRNSIRVPRAPPAALWTACQSPSPTLARARSERLSRPRRLAIAATQASLGQTYAPRPWARPTTITPSGATCNGTSSCCGRLTAHPQHVRIASAIRRPRPWPGGRAGRRSASRGSRCSGSACPTP